MWDVIQRMQISYIETVSGDLGLNSRSPGNRSTREFLRPHHEERGSMLLNLALFSPLSVERMSSSLHGMALTQYMFKDGSLKRMGSFTW